jgi:hypothetical protein
MVLAPVLFCIVWDIKVSSSFLILSIVLVNSHATSANHFHETFIGNALRPLYFTMTNILVNVYKFSLDS